jgi:hypothetical protein
VFVESEQIKDCLRAISLDRRSLAVNTVYGIPPQNGQGSSEASANLDKVEHDSTGLKQRACCYHPSISVFLRVQTGKVTDIAPIDKEILYLNTKTARKTLGKEAVQVLQPVLTSITAKKDCPWRAG